ncbi:MAG: hypothetical protein AAFX93_09340 [Verrucomicrobiota bacterium]
MKTPPSIQNLINHSITRGCTLVATGALFAACSSTPTPSGSVPVVALNEGALGEEQWLTEDGELREIIVQVDAGDQLPIDIAIEGDVVNAQLDEPLVLTATQPFNLYIVPQDGIYLSWDGETYQPFMETLTGSFSLSAKAEANKPASGSAKAVVMRAE